MTAELYVAWNVQYYVILNWTGQIFCYGIYLPMLDLLGKSYVFVFVL